MNSGITSETVVLSAYFHVKDDPSGNFSSLAQETTKRRVS